jgi:hypothetical protein
MLGRMRNSFVGGKEFMEAFFGSRKNLRLRGSQKNAPLRR